VLIGQNRFVLRKGPIFANIILADEINRVAKRNRRYWKRWEYQVTIEGETMPTELFIDARGPIGTGTFPCPKPNSTASS
jgi:MoxR-like ATPase